MTDKTISIVIPAEFAAICDDNNIEPAEMLKQFIADIAELRNNAGERDGVRSTAGSNERDWAMNYFDGVASTL